MQKIWLHRRDPVKTTTLSYVSLILRTLTCLCNNISYNQELQVTLPVRLASIQ